MPTPKIVANGILEEDGDTWMIVSERVIPIDASFSIDLSLEHKSVSVVGRMGIPPSAPGITKLLAEKIVSHEDIAMRAYDLYRSGRGESAVDDWLRAERELLDV
jgi:hypothetical protein